MTLAKDYNSVMGRSADIMKASLGLDFNDFDEEKFIHDVKNQNLPLDKFLKDFVLGLIIQMCFQFLKE